MLPSLPPPFAGALVGALVVVTARHSSLSAKVRHVVSHPVESGTKHCEPMFSLINRGLGAGQAASFDKDK